MKTVLKLYFSAICIIVLVLVFVSKKKEVIVDSVMLVNVEALAEGESDHGCYSIGSIYCPYNTNKVYIIY